MTDSYSKVLEIQSYAPYSVWSEKTTGVFRDTEHFGIMYQDTKLSLFIVSNFADAQKIANAMNRAYQEGRMAEVDATSCSKSESIAKFNPFDVPC